MVSESIPKIDPNLPLLISAKEAARLCHRSLASWWRDLAAGRIPAPVRLGKRTYWRRVELQAWIEVGCPSQERWKNLQRHRWDS